MYTNCTDFLYRIMGWTFAREWHFWIFEIQEFFYQQYQCENSNEILRKNVSVKKSLNRSEAKSRKSENVIPYRQTSYSFTDKSDICIFNSGFHIIKKRQPFPCFSVTFWPSNDWNLSFYLSRTKNSQKYRQKVLQLRS